MTAKESEAYYNATSYEEIFNGFSKGKKEFAMLSVKMYLDFIRRKAEKHQIYSSVDIYNVYKYLECKDVEECHVLILNQANKMVKSIHLSTGGISETSFDIRLILREAILNRASAIAVCHNHPSGNKRPSHADDAVTLKLKEAAQIMNIRLIDHIIITGDSYYSYSDEGRI